VFLWIFALLWCGVSSTVLFLVPGELAKGDRIALVTLIFPFVGLLLLALATHQTLKLARFHRSVLQIDATPVEMGGRLQGRVVLRKSSEVLAQAKTILAQLSCYSRTGSGRSSSESILCRNESEITGASLQRISGGFAIPISIDVPMDGQVTNTTSIVWRLNVSADVPGVDYDSTFVVPVSGTAAEPFRAAPVAPRAPAVMSVVERKTADGLEIVFPPFRAKGMAITVLFFTLVLIGVLAIIIIFHAPLIFPAVFGLFAFILLWITLDLFFGKSAVRIAAENVHISTWFVGSRSERDYPAGDVDDVRLRIGAQSGGDVYYQIEAVLKGGDTVVVGRYLRDKREAEWIASEIRQVTGASARA